MKLNFETRQPPPCCGSVVLSFKILAFSSAGKRTRSMASPRRLGRHGQHGCGSPKRPVRWTVHEEATWEMPNGPHVRVTPRKPRTYRTGPRYARHGGQHSGITATRPARRARPRPPLTLQELFGLPADHRVSEAAWGCRCSHTHARLSNPLNHLFGVLLFAGNDDRRDIFG